MIMTLDHIQMLIEMFWFWDILELCSFRVQVKEVQKLQG